MVNYIKKLIDQVKLKTTYKLGLVLLLGFILFVPNKAQIIYGGGIDIDEYFTVEITELDNTNGDVEIKVKATDDSSGINKIILPDHTVIMGNVATFRVAFSGDYEFIIVDNAGNASSYTVTISNIDKVAPIITIEPYETGPTNKDITVYASVDKGTLNQESYTFTENGEFTFIAIDEYGNEVKKTVVIDNINKIGPIITVNDYYKEPINSDILVTISVEDGVEVNALEYLFTENGEFTFVATDKYGNITEETVVITNIDRSLPLVGSIDVVQLDEVGNQIGMYSKGDLEFSAQIIIPRAVEGYILDDEDNKTVWLTPVDNHKTVTFNYRKDLSWPGWRPPEPEKPNPEPSRPTPPRPTIPKPEPKPDLEKEKKEVEKEISVIKEKLPFTLPYGEFGIAEYLGLDPEFISPKTADIGLGVQSVEFTYKGQSMEIDLEGIKPDAKDKVYRDVSENHWAKDSIEEATKNGFLVGVSDDEYKPSDTLNYADSFVALNRVIMKNKMINMVNERGYIEELTNDFDKEHWAYYSFSLILSKLDVEDVKYITSSGDAIYKTPIKRGEISKVLYELSKNSIDIELVDGVKYNDMTDIPDHVLSNKSTGLMAGDDLGNFNYDGILKRSELATILNRLNNKLAKE